MRAKNEFKFIAETYEQVLKENISGERWGEEWDFSKFSPQLKQAIAEFENGLANMEDMSVFDLKDIVDEIHSANVLDDDVKEQAIGYLRQRAEAAGLEESDLYGEEGIFAEVIKKTSEDNEYGYRETMPINPPEREWKDYRDDYDEESDRAKRYRDDDVPDISDEDRKALRPTRSIKDLDDEIVTMQDIANKKRLNAMNDRVKQIKRDFRGEDNETPREQTDRQASERTAKTQGIWDGRKKRWAAHKK